jgi:hypothetical protein
MASVHRDCLSETAHLIYSIRHSLIAASATNYFLRQLFKHFMKNYLEYLGRTWFVWFILLCILGLMVGVYVN